MVTFDSLSLVNMAAISLSANIAYLALPARRHREEVEKAYYEIVQKISDANFRASFREDSAWKKIEYLRTGYTERSYLINCTWFERNSDNIFRAIHWGPGGRWIATICSAFCVVPMICGIYGTLKFDPIGTSWIRELMVNLLIFIQDIWGGHYSFPIFWIELITMGIPAVLALWGWRRQVYLSRCMSENYDAILQNINEEGEKQVDADRSRISAKTGSYAGQGNGAKTNVSLIEIEGIGKKNITKAE